MVGNSIMYPLLILILSLITNNLAALESNFLTSYDTKVCKNEPSCHLVDQQNLPKSRRTLEGRDCMCDFECAEYNDCCQDSEFYGATTASGAKYFCSPNGKVYMITSCPAEYKDEDINAKCLASTQPLNGPDSSVIRPATSLKRRITYGNAYCALCNDDIDDLALWNVTAGCGEAPAGYFPSSSEATTDFKKTSYYTPEENELSTPSKSTNAPTEKNTNAPTKLTFPLGSGSLFGGNKFTVPSFGGFGGFNIQVSRTKREDLSLDLNKYAKNLDDILKNVKYDEYSKNFVSQYNGKNFICIFSSQLPKDFDLYVRKCVPDLISSCPPSADKAVAEKCLSYTGIVYEKATKKAFKNRDCAKCNNVSEIGLTGCPQATRTAASSLFSTKDKGASAPCGTPELRKKFCS